MDGAHRTHTRLVGAVYRHFEFAMEETGGHKVTGVDGKGFIGRRWFGAGVAHAWGGDSRQDEGEATIQHTRGGHFGLGTGDLTAEARSVEDVLNHARDAAIGGVFGDGIDQLAGFEIFSCVADGAHEWLGGVDVEAGGFGDLEGFVELSLIHLDGILVSWGWGVGRLRNVGGTCTVG